MPNDLLPLCLPSQRIKFNIVLLAAGLSRRLGQPKQLLKKNNQSLLAYFIKMSLALGPEQILVVINQVLSPLGQSLSSDKVQVLINLEAATGVASSIQLAAKHLILSPYPTLILAVDQLHLNQAHLERLVDTAQIQPTANIVSAYQESFGIPALVLPEVLAQSRKLLADQGLKVILKQHLSNVVKVAAPALEFDLDTPEQLNFARQNQWLD